MRKDENITSLGSLNIYYDGEEEGKMNIDIIVIMFRTVFCLFPHVWISAQVHCTHSISVFLDG